jgi:xanthine dehydrogenase accessory factor
VDVLAQAAALARAGEAVALATVIDTSGSVPRHPGAHMGVRRDGSIFGTIGGGKVEQAVTAAGVEVAGGAAARRVQHHLVRDLAMCCGGSMELWIEPVAPSLAVIDAALALWERRRPGLLITPLDGAPKWIEERAAHARIGPTLEAGRFVEPIRPRDRVLLFGCGHVGRAIGALAAQVGFEVIACDDDETGALGRGTPWARQVVPSFELADVERAAGPLGAGDHAVIVTRDHDIDQRLLERLLPRDDLDYLGLIGSRGKVGRFRKRLAERGVATDERWARLRAPIGLDIGAETPDEIAVAVVGELIAVRRRGGAPR